MDEAQFWRQVDSWSRPPIAGVNMSPLEVLSCDKEALGQWVFRTEGQHWAQPRARSIRLASHMDETQNRTVLDFGCGFGFDALVYAQHGNHVSLLDISPLNLAVARSVMRSRDYEPSSLHLAGLRSLALQDEHFDVIHANGVLHHIEDAAGTLRGLKRHLNEDGEIRAMVYSDDAWRFATKTEPDYNMPTKEHPLFMQFVRTMDASGFYAEWYSEAKMTALAAESGLRLERYEKLEPDQIYAFAVLK